MSLQQSSIKFDQCFVLDTNILLYDSHAIYSFAEATVLIPFSVLEELDTFKSENNERGRNARKTIRLLDELRTKGSLLDGVVYKSNEHTALEHSTLVKIIPVDSREQLEAMGMRLSGVDNHIILTTKKLVDAGKNIIFVSRDINARVKADVLGIRSQDYSKGMIEAYSKGWHELELPASEIKAATGKDLDDVIGKLKDSVATNEFVHLKTEYDRAYGRLFRRQAMGGYAEVRSPGGIWNFSEKNVQQLMALDLLLDDSVQLVSLVGPAGTGKTFLTLLAALYKVIKEQQYKKLIVARPVISLGEGLGFLPGTVNEKLFHWMKPVYDNLELILSHSPMSSAKAEEAARRKNSEHPESDKAHERNKYHRDAPHYKPHGGGNYHRREGGWNHQQQDPTTMVHPDIERLMHKEILSFEAVAYMRGRSIPQQFLFVDEVQNMTPHEVKTIVTRAGEGTKIVLAGDPYQIDLPYLDFKSNGLMATAEKFRGDSLFGMVYLSKGERSPLATRAIELL